MAGQSELITAAERAPTGFGVVALSGGPDSAVCAWALVEAGRQVRSVFVDHGFGESPRLRLAAAGIARQLDLAHTEIAVSVSDRGSIEDQARIARYQALLGELSPGEWLATGHTSDDQAETVLMNLLRGAGPEGLGGMPVRRGPIVRPLLAFPRDHVRSVALTLELAFDDDPSNADLSRRRNRIRHQLIPQLEREFNPRVKSVLARSAELISSDAELGNERAGRIPMRRTRGAVELPAPLLEMLPEAIIQRAIRSALRAVHPPYPGDYQDVASAIAVLHGAPTATVAGAVDVARQGSVLRFGQRDEVTPDDPVSWAPEKPLSFGGLRLELEAVEGPLSWRPLSAWRAAFDLETAGSLIVRIARRGETVALDDAAGGPSRGRHKDVRKAMAEAGIDSSRREAWPVAALDDQIVWIPGVRRAPLGWVRADSAGYLWALATEEIR